MTQSTDLTLSPAITGLAQRTELNSILQAIGSSHKGSVRPTYIPGGGLWIDDSADPDWVIYLFDGTDDIAIGTFNTAANTFVPSGTSVISFGNSTSDKTSGFTASVSDAGKAFFNNATSASYSIAFDACATLGLGWYAMFVKTDGGSNTVTLDPDGSELINGDTTLVLRRQNDAAFVFCTGSALKAIYIADVGTLKVSSDDTTPGYIEDKLVAGNGIIASTNNPGSNETRVLGLNFASDPGLEIISSALRVKVGTGIIRDSNGIRADMSAIGNAITRGPTSLVSYSSPGSAGTFNATSSTFIVFVGGGGGGGAADDTSAGGGGQASYFGSPQVTGGGGFGGIQGGIDSKTWNTNGQGSGGDVNITGKGGRGGAGYVDYEGSGNNNIGGAGGNGGLAIKLYTGITPGTGYSYFVANGGAGGNNGADQGMPGEGGFVVVLSF